MERHEIHVHLHGKVQMVMFRDFIQRKARTLALVGYVCNLEGGVVEVVAQGPEDKLNTLILHLNKGPFLARVARADVKWRNPQKEFDTFSIVY
jgi:acylphosphatase